ncbi:MAG: helix-turn-helix transcriptional regulator [Oscillospiraceae bacterium]|nr:helix-turn-helix transcriptional regulator [Oscillospiraceae bacterium]
MFSIRRMSCRCRHDGSFIFNHPEGLDHYLMLYISTAARFNIYTDPRTTAPGTFILYSPGAPVCYGAAGDEYINDWASFETNELIAPPGIFNIPLEIGDSIDAGMYFKLLGDCYFRGGDPMTQKMIIDTLISDISWVYFERTKGIPHFRQLLELRGSIYAEPQKDWSVEEMAKIACVSESYLYTLYKSAFGVTCNADLINSRTEQAKHYLEYTDMGIEEIAYECGYKNPVHFSRQFKQMTGLSPKQWREKNNMM